MLARTDLLPSGSFMNPRHAEVLCADGQWRPVMVLGWHRLDVAHRQAVTDRWIFWFVHLRLESGDEAWFEFDSLNLRPQRRLVLQRWATPNAGEFGAAAGRQPGCPACRAYA